jgi:hypothetical protein
MFNDRKNHNHPSIDAPLYETAQFIEAGNDECQDRIKVISDEGRKIICVADGAGGTGDGSRAAEHVIKEVERSYRFAQRPVDWDGILKGIDQNIPNGQAAAIILDLRQGSATVACVGDCEAWAFFDSSIIRLSDGQHRKPLLGTGDAVPFVKEFGELHKPLIVGTDGFFKYVKADLVPPIVLGAQFFEIPRKLAELVRLHSGSLHDDLAIVSCRLQRSSKKNIRHEI